LVSSVIVVAAIALALLLPGCTYLPEFNEEIKRLAEGEPVPNDTRFATRAFNEIQHGNYAEAETLLEAALDINPGNPYALLNLGVVYEKTGRVEEARAMYTTLIRQNPPHTAVSAQNQSLVGTRIVTIAQINLAALDRAALNRAARSGAIAAFDPMTPSPQALASDHASRMAVRMTILDELQAQGLVTEDEVAARRGGAWMLSQTMPSPKPSDVIDRMIYLESEQKRGLIAAPDYAKQRTDVLDALAPIRAMPKLPEPAETRPEPEPIAQSETSPIAAAPAPPPSISEAAPSDRAPIAPLDTPSEIMTEASDGDSVRIHVASFRSEQAAEAGWRALKGRHLDLLGGLRPTFTRIDLGPDRGVFYRLIAGPLRTTEAAENLCDKLRSRKLFCTVGA
jgi:hypothetical protein